MKDGVIVGAGSRADVEAGTRAPKPGVDLGGRTPLPAFIDGHSHYISALMVANQAQVYAPPSGPGKDVDSIIAAIRAFAAAARSPRAR